MQRHRKLVCIWVAILPKVFLVAPVINRFDTAPDLGFWVGVVWLFLFSIVCFCFCSFCVWALRNCFGCVWSFLFFWLGLPFFGVFSECFCLESLILAQDER